MYHAYGKVGVTIEWSHALIGHSEACLNAISLTSRHLEMIARSHAALLEARGVVVVVLATRIVVGYHKGDVIFGSLFLPSVPVHTSRIGEPRLVVLGVIAHLATAGSCLPVLFEAHVQPTLLVVAVAGAQLVVLVHERVVEQPETQRPQLDIAAEGAYLVLAASMLMAQGMGITLARWRKNSFWYSLVGKFLPN